MDVAGEFVIAYYKSLLYAPTELFKFYDEEKATVWRNMGATGVALKKAMGKRFFVPSIPAGGSVIVNSFAVLPITQGLSVVVNGQFTGTDAALCFTQCFTLTSCDGRWFIESDALTTTVIPVSAVRDVSAGGVYAVKI